MFPHFLLLLRCWARKQEAPPSLKHDTNLVSLTQRSPRLDPFRQQLSSSRVLECDDFFPAAVVVSLSIPLLRDSPFFFPKSLNSPSSSDHFSSCVVLFLRRQNRTVVPSCWVEPFLFLVKLPLIFPFSFCAMKSHGSSQKGREGDASPFPSEFFSRRSHTTFFVILELAAETGPLRYDEQVFLDL